MQQVQPVHETVAEEHTSQLAHLKGSGEVHGVETQVNEEELVRAVEVTHSHPLAQKIQQQLIHPSNEGAEGGVSVETQFSRAERVKVSVSGSAPPPRSRPGVCVCVCVCVGREVGQDRSCVGAQLYPHVLPRQEQLALFEVAYAHGRAADARWDRAADDGGGRA